MATRKKTVATPRTGMLQRTLVGTDPATSQAHSVLVDAVTRMEQQLPSRAVAVVDLAAGATTINHGLGRRPRGASVTPTVADATFAWAMTSANEKQAVITCVGTTQPGATVELY